jgi:TolB protein
MDRLGKDGAAIGKPADYRTVSLSHDGKRVAASVVDQATQKGDIWVLDIARGTSTRLTFDPASEQGPTWSLDDRKIYFNSLRQGRGDIFAKSSFGTGEEELVYGSPSIDGLMSFAPDGLTAWIQSTSKGIESMDILRLTLRDASASAYLSAPYAEMHPAPSPDGRWLAYVSDQSTRQEVYVTSLGSDGGRWQISTDGGLFPTWTRGGREIIFQGLDSKLVAVDVQLAPVFSAGVLKVLFDPRIRTSIPGRKWDVTADGERFLVNRSFDSGTVAPLTLVQNWATALQN